ncbi:MAG: YebC/PmpR family DNA-binding transcriptional regulator [Patescibacteria group bacterium]
MSGHSKWATTKRQKAIVDKKRGNIFTKLTHNISLAAKRGKDPEMNSALRAAIDVARGANMPKENIERAVLKGAGELPGQQVEEITYEGYGPNGVAIVIQCVTDNRNRSASFVKSTLTKFNGSLGGPNSVGYMFKQRGVIRIENADNNKQLVAIDAGAEDVIEEENGLTIYTTPGDLNIIKKKLGAVDYASLDMIASTKVKLDQAGHEKIDRLIEALEESDDVNDVYTNAE